MESMPHRSIGCEQNIEALGSVRLQCPVQMNCKFASGKHKSS